MARLWQWYEFHYFTLLMILNTNIHLTRSWENVDHFLVIGYIALVPAFRWHCYYYCYYRRHHVHTPKLPLPQQSLRINFKTACRGHWSHPCHSPQTWRSTMKKRAILGACFNTTIHNTNLCAYLSFIIKYQQSVVLLYGNNWWCGESPMGYSWCEHGTPRPSQQHK